MTSDDEGEGGGGREPPKNDDVIYEQPLIECMKVYFFIQLYKTTFDYWSQFASFIRSLEI